ncbi:Ankyrin repeat domain-containing protein [Tetrabaena socialis]|uniref:Ankyrin repeat domain-containing protein n=1 Tax=Tetrabaena socialis TaxID=47790 RepID=A0A2J7ZSM8_9CHLO|nr:Ankyrin repeat domain-containing protein [Tetrabaena socialis]|eukprot:PNH03277.1 Ankyrin repeat domain-containing protein [Tetrabaena socialis]
MVAGVRHRYGAPITVGPCSPAAPLTGPMRSRDALIESSTSPPALQLQPAAPTIPTCHDASRIWLPDVVQRFATLLAPNEVACAMRLVNKATAAQFHGPQHTSVRLSQPVPHHAFVWRWAGTDAMRRLTARDRRALPRLTARSGSIANLEVLLARDASGLEAADVQAVIESAAEAGQLDVCAWLRQRGWPLGPKLLDAAAGGGQQAVYEWLLVNGCPKGDEVEAAARAAMRGHEGMMDWLLLGGSAPGETSVEALEALLRAAAAGCALSALERLHHTYLDSRGRELSLESQQAVLSAAVQSPTSDWRAKVEWLEARGYPRTIHACGAAVAMPGALPRLQWLQQQGYSLGQRAAHNAASGGNVEALRYVLGQQGSGYRGESLMAGAAHGGHVAVMEVLHEYGIPAGVYATESAAGGGHLPAVAWLVERLGAGAALTTGVFAAAARAGSMELLVWLRARGCPWDAATFAVVAGDGSEEQLEWLAEQGCPMGDDGYPYVWAAATGHLEMLRCLRRLGCPWSPGGSTFASLLEWLNAGLDANVERALCWLLDQGCPVDWDQAVTIARQVRNKELFEWLGTQRQQRA